MLSFIKYVIILIGDNMKNKGFTLIELTAVVIILALISFIGFSYITNQVNSKKQQLSDAFNKVVYDASDIYVSYNENNYPMIDGNVYCIKFNELIDYEILTTPLVDPITNKEVSLDNYVKLEVNVDEFLYEVVQTCTEKR